MNELVGLEVVHADEGAAVIRHDAADIPMPDASVDLIVTSPPYFALRSYRDDGDHFDGQIGSEDTPGEFVEALSACMVEWRRLLKPGGSVWVNLGDKYAGSGGHNNADIGSPVERGPVTYNRNGGAARPKSLMGLPWRFALVQIDAGWILRAEVIWDKPNGLPESVTDRVRRSHEQWFHFTKEPQYFSGVDEIRVPLARDFTAATAGGARHPNSGDVLGRDTDPHGGMARAEANPLGRIPGSVWRIPSEPLTVPDHLGVDHFAAFPQEWPRRIITGWSPSGICVECGEGRRPVVATSQEHLGVKAGGRTQGDSVNPEGHGGGWDGKGYPLTRSSTTITGYECACPPIGDPAPTTPAVVLDPFGGTGTTAGVARTLGRFGISNDLSNDYNRLAVWRIWSSGHFTKSEQRQWADRQMRIT